MPKTKPAGPPTKRASQTRIHGLPKAPATFKDYRQGAMLTAGDLTELTELFQQLSPALFRKVNQLFLDISDRLEEPETQTDTPEYAEVLNLWKATL